MKKFCSRTVVYFTLDLLETNKVQEVKLRDCHWCISIYFASEKLADILKLLVVFGRAKIRFRSFTQFQIKLHRRTTVHNVTVIDNTWKL